MAANAILNARPLGRLGVRLGHAFRLTENDGRIERQLLTGEQLDQLLVQICLPASGSRNPILNLDNCSQLCLSGWGTSPARWLQAIGGSAEQQRRGWQIRKKIRPLVLWVTSRNSILNLGTGEGRYDAKVHSKLATKVSKLRGRSQICQGKFVSGRQITFLIWKAIWT